MTRMGRPNRSGLDWSTSGARKQWRGRHPHSAFAHNYARKRISVEGKLCERCGATENLVRHHPNYKEALSVVILCKSCHQKLHGEKS